MSKKPTRRKKPGPKPSPDGLRRNQLGVMLTTTERKKLDAASGTIPTSIWARALLLAEAERIAKAKGTK